MKKLREENENLSDLMLEECRSCSESSSSNESYQKVLAKWHSAEDLHRQKKVRKNGHPNVSIYDANAFSIVTHRHARSTKKATRKIVEVESKNISTVTMAKAM